MIPFVLDGKFTQMHSSILISCVLPCQMTLLVLSTALSRSLHISIVGLGRSKHRLKMRRHWLALGVEGQRLARTEFVCRKVLSSRGTNVFKMQRLLAVFFFASVAFGQCPDGFLHHIDSCYAVPAATATWAQATMYCRVLGADLAIIETADEQHYLEGFLQRTTNGLPGDHDFWVAGSDFLEEGSWIWVRSQSPIDPLVTFWAPGQPANVNSHQSCLRISEALAYKWEDGSCDSPEYFICERPFNIGDGGTIG